MKHDNVTNFPFSYHWCSVIFLDLRPRVLDKANVEKTCANKIDLYHIFIDFIKPYDSIDKKELLKTIINLGIHKTALTGLFKEFNLILFII